MVTQKNMNMTTENNEKTTHTPKTQKRNRKTAPLTKQSKPWFGTAYTTSGHETEWAYSYSPGAHTVLLSLNEEAIKYMLTCAKHSKLFIA